MHPHHQAYLYAIASCVSFATASLVFAHFAKMISSAWMNFYKAVVCLILMVSTLLVFGSWVDIPISTAAALFLSGILGLGIGDLFLLKAYARMGAGRTLILFGFQPFFLGLASWYLFGQELGYLKIISVFFFVACLFLFSLEKYKEAGKWEIISLVAAFLGVCFDNTGILLSRWSFDSVPTMNALQANVVRVSGAVTFFIICSPFLKAKLKENFVKLTGREKISVTAAVFAGTFLSLLFYLTAVRIGHLASIAGLGVGSPLLSTTLECIIYRKRPTIYLILGIVSFLIGFFILLQSN